MVYLFWLSAAACARIRTVDVTSTTEQRATEWMTFESLPDFLDPTDPTKTTKGPAPLRSARWSLRQAFRRLTQYGHAGLAA